LPASAQPGSTSLRLAGVAMLALWAVVLARALGLADAGQRPWYVAGFALFLAITLVVLLWRRAPSPLLHVALAAQAALVLLLLGIEPQRDFVTVLFLVQCFEAAVVFPALARTIWVALLVALIGLSLVFELDLVLGLSRGFVTMAGGVVLAMYVVVIRELDAERAASEGMVTDLRAAQERLQAYAGQADELAAIEQRTRVAAELEESVTRTLTDVLASSAAAQDRLDEPGGAGPELERLQELTKEALAQMRRVITELRPTQR
jgi:signal transduction histidine kinase